jgi:hypothetical protein
MSAKFALQIPLHAMHQPTGLVQKSPFHTAIGFGGVNLGSKMWNPKCGKNSLLVSDPLLKENE